MSIPSAFEQGLASRKALLLLAQQPPGNDKLTLPFLEVNAKNGSQKGGATKSARAI
jgi:hypothetical protein